MNEETAERIAQALERIAEALDHQGEMDRIAAQYARDAYHGRGQ